MTGRSDDQPVPQLTAAEVSRCHEATAFDHCCRVCATPGEPYYDPRVTWDRVDDAIRQGRAQ